MNELTQKYKDREREAILTAIITQMQQWGITYEELQAHDEVTETDTLKQVVSIRKRQKMKSGVESVRRKIPAV